MSGDSYLADATRGRGVDVFSSVRMFCVFTDLKVRSRFEDLYDEGTVRAVTLLVSLYGTQTSNYQMFLPSFTVIGLSVSSKKQFHTLRVP